ncbi:hypothetical protein QYE76_024011 [Lolium multiflorum]|uniref:CCHC-type domain-containing protein n=1 Tax=Lolium multiflorum TaxID=4521 RepID=A0AAD8RFG9_LOLMU|nr:hypothetical protein QYE76_024011 [Lolium multiflorum]
MEGKLNQANENRKRRMMHQSGPSNNSKFRPGSSGGFTPRNNRPPAQMSRPGYQNRSGGNPRTGGHHHNSNNFVHHNNNFNRAPTRAPANPNTNTAPRTGSNAVPVAPKDKSTINCYECGVLGHYSKECPQRLAKMAANTTGPAQQQRRVANNKKFAPNNPNNRSGRLFHMSAEEAQEAPDVVLGKANVVADALSRLPCQLNSMIAEEQPSLHQEFEQFRMELVSEGFLASIELQPTLISQIKEAQKSNASIDGIKSQLAAGKAPGFTVDEEGVLWYNGRLCVPSDSELKQSSPELLELRARVRRSSRKLCVDWSLPERRHFTRLFLVDNHFSEHTARVLHRPGMPSDPLLAL